MRTLRILDRKGGAVHDAVSALLWAALALSCAPSAAAELRLRVTDGTGPLQHVLFSLHSEAASAAVAAGEGVMDQVDSQFAPRVLAVGVGSRVNFPNRDDVRHHVYSFSPAKRFELPLYSGTPSEPVTFGVPGVVALGCNIHDWMIGFIHVLDTPHHAVSDAEGIARIEAPAGRYEMRVWHERAGEGAAARAVELTEGQPLEQVIELTLAPPPPPRGDERLRALQERFRSLGRDRP